MKGTPSDTKETKKLKKHCHDYESVITNVLQLDIRQFMTSTKEVVVFVVLESVCKRGSSKSLSKF